MKLFTLAILITGLVLGTAYVCGAFEFEANITVDKQLKEDTVELTYDTINKAQESLNKAFDIAKEKLEERNEK